MSWAAKPHSEWQEEDLLACARWWAEELGMGAWDVRAQFYQRHELDGAQANCTFNGAYEYVQVRVAEWRSLDLNTPTEGDLEASVVHELVHARFWSVDVATSAEVHSQAYETAIDRTARALVRMRRRDR